MSLIQVVETLAAVGALVLTDLRWLRVAQREHYAAGAVSIFVRRWWYRLPKNLALWVVALAAFVISSVFEAALLVTALAFAIGPIGLSPRGRTSKLVWTRRSKTLAAALFSLQALCVLIGLALDAVPFVLVMVTLLAPTFVELALAITRPRENKIADGYVAEAVKRLDDVSPLVVAVAGSYGKTSIKAAVEHLLAGSKNVFVTPDGFEDRSGLTRCINEQLEPGAEVFVAEMSTHGLGEIADLCEICPPDIAVLTAVGPVHLERFGSEAAIIAATSEVFEAADVAVINVDDDRLDRLADSLEEAGKAVWRCGETRTTARVRAAMVEGVTVVTVDGDVVAEIEALDTAPSNVACAVAVALELEVPVADLAERLQGIPPLPHRLEIVEDETGVTVIDDTVNLNPAGAERALGALRTARGKRRIVATPGMIELGMRQSSANTAFAEAVAESATDLIVIGSTNRKALLEGAKERGVNVVVVDRLPQAVAWVRDHAEPGDAVLYANDLPDHYA